VGHDRSRGKKSRNVQVVSAGVRDGNVVPGVILGVNFARVGKAGFFFDWQRIQFGSEHDRRAGAVLKDGNEASAADVFGDVVT
jgi:hypothetical protein